MAGRKHAASERAGTSRLSLLSAEEFQATRQANKKLMVYSVGIMSTLIKELGDDGSGCALLDQSGCVLTIRSGGERFDRWAAEKCFRRGVRWPGNVGATDAVSRGLREKLPLVTGPQENGALWEDVFLSFAPIHPTGNRAQTDQTIGGIAVIKTVGQRDAAEHAEVYRVIARAISDEISTLLRVSDDFTAMMSSNTQAFFIVEALDGEYHLTNCSENLGEFFSLGTLPTFYARFEEFIPDVPENAQIWDVLRGRGMLNNTETQYVVNGKSYFYMTTVCVFNEIITGAVSISFILSSQKEVAEIVSKKIGYHAKTTFADIIGQDEAFRKMLRLAQTVAPLDQNVLILGESGVGKDLIAQSVHNASKRRDMPFIAINCGAIPRELIASELFGYEPGAFTGAKRNGQIGKFELANGGTLFLDEIGNMPIDLQAVLLRAVETGVFTRVGGTKEISVDIRILSATNVNIKSMIEMQQFRADLYYRLCNFTLNVPPLRERRDDIPLLVHEFANRISLRSRGKKYEIAPEVMERLTSYSWPGNIRELQSCVECMAHLLPDGIHSPDQMDSFFVGADAPTERVLPPLVRHTQRRSELSREDILEALQRNQYHKGNTAASLGISRATLYRLLDHYGL